MDQLSFFDADDFVPETPAGDPRHRVAILTMPNEDAEVVVFKNDPKDFEVWLYADESEAVGLRIAVGESKAHALQVAEMLLWKLGSAIRMAE